MKIIFTILVTVWGTLCAEENNPEETFPEFYRSWADLKKESADDQSVRVFFVDLDGDGNNEAFATSKPFIYEQGEAIWSGFYYSEGQWNNLKGIGEAEGEIVDSGSLFGRVGEFFMVEQNDGTKEMLILRETFDRNATGGVGELNKSSVKVNGGKVILENKIRNIEHYLAYGGLRKTGLIKSLVQIKVKFFPHPKK